MVETFDQEKANEVGNEAYDALKAVAERHGLTVWHRGGKYDAGSLTERYEFKVKNVDGVMFKESAWTSGLKPEDLGRTFTDNGRTFEVVGLKPGRAKPVVVRDKSDDKEYLADAGYVRDLLAGIDPRAKAEAARKEREEKAATLQKGDRAMLTEVRPKYLDLVLVDVVSVDKKTKTAVVRLVDGVWVDQRAKKRFGTTGMTARFDQLIPQRKPKVEEDPFDVALRAVK